ncbi:hypothetical protein [Krasilnikovia sp. M28-CT-15]|uniref:hypothetical protein n=1 Tax=Krasilnikovia sp. M28-CT-15 TaxID=3373540 RepID=UPI00399D12BB
MLADLLFNPLYGGRASLLIHLDRNDDWLSVDIRLDNDVDFSLYPEHGVAQEFRFSNRDPRLGKVLADEVNDRLVRGGPLWHSRHRSTAEPTTGADGVAVKGVGPATTGPDQPRRTSNHGVTLSRHEILPVCF